MRTLVIVLLALVATALAVENEVNFIFAGMVPSGSGGDSGGFTTTKVSWVETTDLQQTEGFGNSSGDGTNDGDWFGFRNNLLDSTGTTQVGVTVGFCQTLVYPAGTCQWTLLFDGTDDSLNVVQSWADFATAQYSGWASVVGGTGLYKNAGGQCYVGLFGNAGYTDDCELYYN